MPHDQAAVKLSAAEKRIKAHDLRLKGWTFDEIGRAIGTTRQRAHQIITEHLEKLAEQTAEKSEQIRAVEVAKLDRLERILNAKIEAATEIDPDDQPDPAEIAKRESIRNQAIDRLIKIQERRAKLLGLDGPIKLASTDPTGEHESQAITDDERLARLAELFKQRGES